MDLIRGDGHHARQTRQFGSLGFAQFRREAIIRVVVVVQLAPATHRIQSVRMGVIQVPGIIDHGRAEWIDFLALFGLGGLVALDAATYRQRPGHRPSGRYKSRWRWGSPYLIVSRSRLRLPVWQPIMPG